MPNLLVSATTRYDPKGLNKAKKHISGFEKTIKDLGKTFAGVFSAQKILAFGKASVQAFAADDKAAKVLSRTLSNLGLAFADPSVKTFIGDLEKQYGVLDDFLRPAYQKLITTTGDLGKSQDLLKTALDLSAQSGESLVSVTSDIARAYAGNTKGLQKYGLGLTKAQLTAMSFEDILKKITEISSGQAAVAANTYAGKLDKLNVAAQNASETIGGALVDAFVTIAGDGNIDKAISKIDLLAQSLATLISPTRMKSIFAGVDLKYGIIPINKPAPKYGPAQQSPGERNAAVAYNKKLAAQKREELATLAAKNKATREEAQMKKDQAALDELKKKFDLERIGLNAALNQATDEETKARIRAQIAILDETGKTAQAANDALVKAQAAKVEAELKAGAALQYLATSAGLASTGIIKWISSLEMTKEKFGNAGATGPFAGGPAAVKPDNSGAIGSKGGGTTTDAQKWAQEIFDAGTNMPDTPIVIPVYGAGSGGGAGQGEGQVPAAAFNVVVNTGATLADENTIVDAVQMALNEIARRGYLTTYAGALPA
jgi:hypothetical protein